MSRAPRTTAPAYSAAAHLDELRAEAALVTRAVFAELPETQAQLAARLDTTQSRVSALSDSRSEHRLRIHEAAALPPVAAVAIAEFVVGAADLLDALVELLSGLVDAGRILAWLLERDPHEGAWA